MLEISKTVSVGALFSSYYQEHESDFKFAGERHDFWEFLYVLDGCVGVTVENRVYEVTEGKMIFYAPFEFHSTWAARGTSHRNIIMSFSLQGTGLEQLTRRVFDVGEEEDALIRRAVDAADRCRKYDDLINKQRIANSLEALILNLLEKHAPPTVNKKTPGTENYRMIINVMNDNVEKNLSCKEIAQLCNLGVSNLKRIFRKYSGTGVMKYYSNLRMQKAMKMIGEGKRMSEISAALNFSSQNYFTEVFKRQCGTTPSRYKQLLQTIDLSLQ